MAITPGTIEVTEGSGKKLDTATVTVSAQTVHREIVSIGSPDASTPTRYADVTANGLKVDGSAVTQPVSGPLTDAELRATPISVDGSGVTQPISAASLPLPSGAATAANQTTANSSLSSIDGKLPALSGGKVPVTDPTALPLPSGAATAANQSTANTSLASIDTQAQAIAASAGVMDDWDESDRAKVNLIASQAGVDGDSGVKSAKTLRVVIATDQPQLTNKLLVTPDANSAVNVAQINGVTPLMGAGNTGTGSPRVTIASDQVAIPVKQNPQTSGGCSTASGSIQAAATSIKASAGQLYSLIIGNSNTAPVYAQLFDLATGSVTLGTTTPKMSIFVPAGGALVWALDSGIAFATAITIAFTTSRAGSGAPSNSVDYNAAYV